MLVEVILAGALISWFFGGKITRLANLDLKHAELILAAFALQAVIPKLSVGDEGLGFALHIASYLLIFFALSRNEPTPAIGLIALGIFLNFVVIGANRGMPVPATALPAGFHDGIHVEMSQSTRFLPLADVIMWPFPPSLISVGDIILAGGIILLLIDGMRYRGRRRAPENDREQSAKGRPAP